MAPHLAAGIDIGSSRVKAIIAEEQDNGAAPKIVGTGLAESKGIHLGYVSDIKEAAESISVAVRQAEKTAKTKIKRAFISIGGIGLGGLTSLGSAVNSRADLEITSREMKEALEAAESTLTPSATINRRIINTIPVEWKVDGKTVWGRVEGLRGQKLEVKALFITCLEHHIEDLIKAVELAGIEVVDVVVGPIASSFVTLSKKQMRAGCLLANIGAETLSIMVFENGAPLSIEVFPIGSNAVTNDIALGLKVSLEEAESIKLGSLTRSTYPRKKLDEIISARLYDCFELIQAHLKKISRNELLPAGIIITGGGACLPNIKSYAEESLGLPASLASIHFGGEEKAGAKDSLWSTAYGLAVFGFNAEEGERVIGTRSAALIREKSRRGIRVLSDWITQFLP